MLLQIKHDQQNKAFLEKKQTKKPQNNLLCQSETDIYKNKDT